MRRCLFLVVFLLCAATVARAEPPTVTVPDVPCVPMESNGVINASVQSEVGGTTTRVYFRWDEHGAMYFVDMVAAGGGQYWGIPPKPEPRNENLEFYVAVMDAYGQTLARSENMLTPVKADCPVELSPKQVGVANNLVVGETVPAQEGNRILGFLCDGIVSRVNHEGIMRPDEVCRGCVIPWWTKQDYILPAAAVPPVGGLLICCSRRGEVSPSRP